MGFTPSATAQPANNPVSIGCEWDDHSVGTTGAQVGVALLTQVSHGLTDIYKSKNQAAYWQPTTVEGYPGVLNEKPDERADGTCFLDLGLTDSDAALLDYQGDPGSQPCDKVQAVAGLVVQALKGGS